jgi:EpsI family protein
MDKVKTKKLAALIAILTLLAAYTYVLRYREVVPPDPPRLDRIPMAVGDFIGYDVYQEPASLRVLGADTTLFRSFQDDEGKVIRLFLGYFGTQHERAQIHSPKHCYPGAGWGIVAEKSAEIHSGTGVFRATHLSISDGRDRREVIYWFDTADGIINNEFVLKWYQMKRALIGKPQVSAFIRFSTVVSPADEISWQKIIDFIEAIVPDIRTALHGSSGTAVTGTNDSVCCTVHDEAAGGGARGTYRGAAHVRITE